MKPVAHLKFYLSLLHCQVNQLHSLGPAPLSSSSNGQLQVIQAWKPEAKLNKHCKSHQVLLLTSVYKWTLSGWNLNALSSRSRPFDTEWFSSNSHLAAIIHNDGSLLFTFSILTKVWLMLESHFYMFKNSLQLIFNKLHCKNYGIYHFFAKLNLWQPNLCVGRKPTNCHIEDFVDSLCYSMINLWLLMVVSNFLKTKLRKK